MGPVYHHPIIETATLDMTQNIIDIKKLIWDNLGCSEDYACIDFTVLPLQ